LAERRFSPERAAVWPESGEEACWMLFFSDDQQSYIGNGIENQPDDFVQTKERIIGHVKSFTRDLE